MENVTKALLIAGGILIAIIIITMFLMMYDRIASIRRTQEESVELEQLAAFNAQYEAYNKKIMYGADVITLIKKVNETNETTETTEIKITYPLELNKFDGGISDESKDMLKKQYRCETMTYDANTGKINFIKIVNK